MRIFILLIQMLTVSSLAIAQTQVAPLDIIIAISNTVSMQQSDPNRLLPQAVLNLINGLGTTDQISIISFGQTSRVVLPWTKVLPKTTPNASTTALEKIDYSETYTDITGSMEQALNTLATQPKSSSTKQIIILVTNGKTDFGSALKDNERKKMLIDDILPRIKQHGVQIFGLTITENADITLIQTLASATNGDYYRLLTVAEIDNIFKDILKRLHSYIVVVPPVATISNHSTDTTHPSKSDGWTNILVLITLLTLFIVVFWWWFYTTRNFPAARLIDESNRNGRVYQLPVQNTQIGSAQKLGNNIVINSKAIAPIHASIEYRRDKLAFYLINLSSGDTKLNGVDVSQNDRNGALLRHRDELTMANLKFSFLIDAELKSELQ